MNPHELPAMVNAHSHAFQRDLRGAAERPAPEAHAADDFWSWREAMYALARRHDPDSMREVAGRVYAEMAAAGYGAVGEFHYVHHQPDGTPYDEPNAMAIAVAEAARAAGLRDRPAPRRLPPRRLGRRRPAALRGPAPLLRPDRRRLPRARRRAARLGRRARRRARRRRGAQRPRGAGELARGDRRLLRAARPRPPRARARAAARAGGVPRRARRSPPIELLDRSGFLGPRTSLVHGIHVDAGDVRRLAESDTIVVSCPTTEGSLGDGHFPALDLPRRRRADRDRHRLAGARRPVRGGARARDARPPRAAHPPRAARGLRRPLGRAGRATAARASGLDDAGTIAIDRDHPDLRGVADADLALAVATCASAAVVCRGAGAG